MDEYVYQSGVLSDNLPRLILRDDSSPVHGVGFFSQREAVTCGRADRIRSRYFFIFFHIFFI